MGRKRGGGRISECHPDQPHHGHGLCWKCYYKKHRDTIIDRSKEHYKKDPEKKKRYVRSRWIERTYGLSEEQYNAILEKQNGLCAICLRDPKEIKPVRHQRIRRHRELVIDHNHETGKVRGLLCQHCNVMMFTLDHPDWLEKATKYKKETECSFT